MFYHIRGTIAYMNNSCIVLDANGVGYKMTVSMNTFSSVSASALNNSSSEVKLFTELSVREDGIELFGFASIEELEAFKLLISVSGVGPRAAMSILSLLTPDKLALAICSDDKKTISKASNIGPKTAARIILELKDKISKTDLSTDSVTVESVSVGASSSKLGEAEAALSALGYTRSEISAVIRKIDTSSLSVEDIIRQALKQLMK